jgi:3' terminal RNA ribose 2'-O-methyltransferase Hen1
MGRSGITPGLGADCARGGQYVNDRPYAASSMMAVALGRVFGTAMAGRCAARPELAAAALPLEITIPALPCHGGAQIAERLFGPLGWTVEATPVPLDPLIPGWGDSRYVGLRLSGQLRLADALSHLYVLLPVLDNAKHYWVSTDEVDKLIRAGSGWLGSHPDRDLITRRYLAHRRELVLTAVGRLAEADDTEPETLEGAVSDDGPDETPERQLSLAQQRRGAVLAALRAAGAATVAGDTDIDGSAVCVNPSGGLVARGHPLGATGLCQIAELVHQLLGRAVGRQRPGARIGVAVNTGGIISGDAAVVGIHVLQGA